MANIMNNSILSNGAYYTKEGAIILPPCPSVKELQLQKKIEELELELMTIKTKYD